MAKYWYSYTNTSPQTSTSILVTTNYTKLGTAHVPSCPGNASKICQIYATGSAGTTTPSAFPTRTSGYISTAFSSTLDQPTTPGAYAYVRGL